MAKCDFPKCNAKAVEGYKEDVGGYITCWCTSEDHAKNCGKVIANAGRYLTKKELNALK
jgi:hypothetical protein